MNDEEQTLVVLFILGVFSITGTVGNALVLYIYSKKKDKSTSSIFILSLAATDFLTCLVIIPYNIATLYLGYKLVYDIVCHVYMFLITCNVPFAAFIMVAIAIDRYFCICHPFLHVITIFRAKIIILILAVFSCALGSITSSMYAINRDKYIYLTTETEVEQEPEVVLSGQNTTFTSFLAINTTDSNINITRYTQGYQNTTASHVHRILNDYYELCSHSTTLTAAVTYSKFHFALYILIFFIVVVLYILIYKEIHIRRARKAKRKRSSLFPSSPVEISIAETQLTALNGNCADSNENNICHKRKKSRKISTALKEKQFYANIRTAAMLFIVTVVFVIAFLPAWLMAHELLHYNIIVFYMYYMYNIANPVIYSFMNSSFRTELRTIFSKCCNWKKNYKQCRGTCLTMPLFGSRVFCTDTCTHHCEQN